MGRVTPPDGVPARRSGSITTSRSTPVLLAAVLGTALAYMSDDMLNLAVPSVARDLGATMTDVQWILNAYYVTLVSSVLIAGSIGDIVGHRRVFTAGIVLFALGAIVCAVAPAVPVMVVGRGGQGLGAAMLLTAGLALVARLTPSEQRGRALGRFFGLAAAVPAIGPFLSGALVDVLSWRWLFVVPLALPLVALTITFARVPETERAEARRPDLPGAVLAFVTLSTLSAGLILGAADPGSPVAFWALAAATLAGALFVVAERRVADPMLPLHLFREPAFLGGNVVWLIGAMTCWAAVFFLAVNLQVTLGLRPVMAGLVLVPIYLIMMVGSPIAGRRAESGGGRRLVVAGLAIYAVGLWLLSSIGATAAFLPGVLGSVIVFSIGMALFTAPLATLSMAAVGEAAQGIASGVNNAMGQLAGLLAVVLLPPIAGLSGIGFDDPSFAAGSATALRLAAVLAVLALGVAAVAFRGTKADRKVPSGATA